MEIFYPNNLKLEEIKNLNSWKLKVATLHFGKGRVDCIRLGYGYSYRPEKPSDLRPDYDIDENNTIILVADKDNEYNRPISLRNEIDWDNPNDLLHECGVSYEDILRNYLKEQFE